MGKTHFSELNGRIDMRNTPPSTPVVGDMFYDIDNNSLMRYTGNTWIGFHFTNAGVVDSADPTGTPGTHFSALASAVRNQATDPSAPEEGEWYVDTDNNQLKIYANGAWGSAQMTTTTSTSTSTTTTSTSTTSTSSSTSSSTSTSLTTSTSTTTTL